MNLPFPLQSGVNAIKAAAFARMLVVILNFMGLLKADSVASTPACIIGNNLKKKQKNVSNTTINNNYNYSSTTYQFFSLTKEC